MSMTTSRSAEAARIAFAADVRAGLGASPKKLPSHYFYDELGSQLFEAICQLPWYPITRAERCLLERHAGEMVARWRESARSQSAGRARNASGGSSTRSPVA